jgi:hypothetical protein
MIAKISRQMAAGSTLGSPKALVVIQAAGAIEKLYSIDVGKAPIGIVVLHLRHRLPPRRSASFGLTAVYLDLTLEGWHAVRSYNSLHAAREESRIRDTSDLHDGRAVQIGRKGFCIIESRQEV